MAKKLLGAAPSNVLHYATLGLLLQMGVPYRIRYTGSAWPARSVPAWFTGDVIWDSTAFPGVASPPGMVTGDYWEEQTA